MGWVNWWSPSLSSYPAAPPPQRTQSRDFPCTTSHSHSLQDHPKHSNKLTKVVRLLTTQVSGAPPGAPTPPSPRVADTPGLLLLAPNFFAAESH